MRTLFFLWKIPIFALSKFAFTVLCNIISLITADSVMGFKFLCCSVVLRGMAARCRKKLKISRWMSGRVVWVFMRCSVLSCCEWFKDIPQDIEEHLKWSSPCLSCHGVWGWQIYLKKSVKLALKSLINFNISTHRFLPLPGWTRNLMCVVMKR